jgi:hypothetical protein
VSEPITLTPLTWDGDRAPLAKAFVAAQKATESVKKAATNPAFKSSYADLAHVVEGVVPALNAAGVGVLQFPGFDGDLVSLTTTLLHESGASVTSTLHLRPSKSDPQGVGSAITYARRYALLAMTGAAPEDDDGNAASGPRSSASRPEPKRQETSAPTLGDRADRLEATLKGVKSVSELDKAFNLASGLCAELSDKDPKRLAQIEALRSEREEAFARALQKEAA